jgi:hypothetical protein
MSFFVLCVSQEAAAKAALDMFEHPLSANVVVGSGVKSKNSGKGKGKGAEGSSSEPSDGNTIAIGAATASLYGTCRECGNLDQGDYDAGDGLFYCNTCWGNYGR